MHRLDQLISPSATPYADRWSLFARTAADDLNDLGYGGGSTTEDEDTDERDESTEETDESAESNDATLAKEEAEGSEETDETDPDYKKRFVNSQKQHLADKREMDTLRGQISSVEQELRRLRTPATQPATPSTTARKGLNEDDFYHELNSVSATDPDAKRKVVSKWVSAIKAEAKAAVDEASAAARTAARQEVQGVEQQKKAYDQAKKDGLSALERAGFSKEDLSDAFDDLEREVNHLMATDRDFFERQTSTEQFSTLADMVKARWERRTRSAAMKANQAHERRAGGAIGSSRQATPSRTSKTSDVKTLTFSQAMVKDRENRTQMRMGLARRSA